MADIRQVGIATSFGNELDAAKVNALVGFAGLDYAGTGNLLRAGGNYRIVIERNDKGINETSPIAEIGPIIPSDASYVAVANRGITYEGHPGRMRVFLWK